MILRVGRRILEELGYTVLTAGTPSEDSSMHPIITRSPQARAVWIILIASRITSYNVCYTKLLRAVAGTAMRPMAAMAS